MSKRHSDALFIQEGASNPSGIIHSMLDACKEIMSDPKYGGTDQVRRDSALRLMTHQLAFLLGIPTGEGFSDYAEWTQECRNVCKSEDLKTLA